MEISKLITKKNMFDNPMLYVLQDDYIYIHIRNYNYLLYPSIEMQTIGPFTY
jgi:hypothetical protein